MSRGTSQMQREILSALRGERMKVFHPSGGALDTSEIVEELEARGFRLPDNRKSAMFTVRRACDSLGRRGYLSSKYAPDWNNPGRKTVSWSLADDRANGG